MGAARQASIISVADVHKSFGRKAVLRGVTFTAHAGQIVAILGENGSGKSTLLKILAGALASDRGSVTCGGQIGYCPQEQVLYPYLTVDEHLALFACAYGLDAATRARRIDKLGAMLDFPRRERVEDLSGGTRQRLNLALALLHDPAVVLLDEPYAGLDVASYRGFLGWVEEARGEGKCVLLITHLLLDESRCDTVLHLKDGRIHA